MTEQQPPPSTRPASADDAAALVRAHLEAVTTDAERLRELWRPDATYAFPYAASVGVAERLDGLEAMIRYFGPPRRFRDWSFGAIDARVADEGATIVAEVHATAIHLESGGRYEQDYAILLGVADDGRLAWGREYWDPTRVPAAPGG